MRSEGLDIATTKPLGAQSSKLERFGIKTPIGNDNRKVREQNLEGHKYLEKLFEMAAITSTGLRTFGTKPSGTCTQNGHKLQFNGVLAKLFLKECEWQFNNPDPKTQFKQLKQWVAKHMG